MITSQDEAAIEEQPSFPYGKCGDSPEITGDGCGVALTREEADNGVCHNYPDCVLP